MAFMEWFRSQKFAPITAGVTLKLASQSLPNYEIREW